MNNEQQSAIGLLFTFMGIVLMFVGLECDSPFLRRIIVAISAALFAIPVLKLLVIFIAA